MKKIIINLQIYACFVNNGFLNSLMLNIFKKMNQGSFITFSACFNASLKHKIINMYVYTLSFLIHRNGLPQNLHDLTLMRCTCSFAFNKYNSLSVLLKKH